MAETVDQTPRAFTLGEFRRLTEALDAETSLSVQIFDERHDQFLIVGIDEVQIRHITDSDPQIVLGTI